MSWRSWRGGVAKKLMAEASDKAVQGTLAVVGEQADSQVPHDTGDLSRTRFIKVKNGKGLISYGGGPGTPFKRVPYAVRWHENSANFQKGRKKRYLADPFNRYAKPTLKKLMQLEGQKRL